MINKKTILQLGKFYYPISGGIEQVMFEIVNGLSKDGYKCDVLCSNTKLKYEENKFENYTVFRASSLAFIKSTSISPQLVYKLLKICKNYDFIHVHYPDPMTFLALYLVRPKAKIIVHWHSDIIRQKKLIKFFLPLQRWVLRFSDKIIVTSNNYALYSKHLQEFKEKLVTVPIGILHKNYELDNFYIEKIKNKYKNKKIILALGRLVSYKGFIYLVKSAQYLNEDFIILIGGSGLKKEELQKYITLNNLKSKVELLGYLSEKEKNAYLHSCFVFCLPSITRAEAFGVVLLEAMTFSKPLVTSSIKGSGMDFVNKNKITGLHVEPKNPKALAKAFKSLTEDDLFYKTLCKNSFNRYQKLFTRDKMITSIKKVYNSVI